MDGRGGNPCAGAATRGPRIAPALMFGHGENCAGAADRHPSDAVGEASEIVIDIDPEAPGAQESPGGPMAPRLRVLQVTAGCTKKWVTRSPLSLLSKHLLDKMPGAASTWDSPDLVFLVGENAVFLSLGTVRVICTENVAYIYAPQKKQAKSVASAVLTGPRAGEAFLLNVIGSALELKVHELERTPQRGPLEAGGQDLQDLATRAGLLKEMLSGLQKKSEGLQHIAGLGRNGSEGAQEEVRKIDALIEGYLQRCACVQGNALFPPILYEVRQITSDGTVVLSDGLDSPEHMSVSMSQLSKYCKVHLSDMAPVVRALWETDPQQALWLSSEVAFLASGRLQLLCSRKWALVFYPNTNEAKSFLDAWSKSAPAVEGCLEYFMVTLLKSAVTSVISLLSNERNQVDAEVKALEGDFRLMQEQETCTQALETCQQKLGACKQKAQNLGAKGTAFPQVLDNLLPSAQGQPASVLQLSTMHVQLEKLVESLLKEWMSVDWESSIDSLQRRVVQLEDKMRELPETNRQRDEDRKGNIALAVMVCTVFTSVLGMNAKSGLEESYVAFWLTTALVILIVGAFFVRYERAWKYFHKVLRTFREAR